MRKFILFCAKILAVFIVLLPMSVQMFIGDVIGVIWFDILRIRRRVALDNLRQCFPEWSEEQRITTARSSLRNIGRSIVEVLRIPAVSHANVGHLFKYQGLENLTDARERKNGVFLLTAHVGNGDWAAVGLALKGISLHVISKEFKFKLLNDLWFQIRRNLGTEFIPDRQSSLTILKVLKRGGLVGFMLDQFLGPPIGVKTRFFGRETGTPMGLALLAGRSRSAVVPCYSYRDDLGVTTLVFEPEILFVESQNKEETIFNMTQCFCDRIEQWVRAHPDQWLWVHRRWKRFKV